MSLALNKGAPSNNLNNLNNQNNQNNNNIAIKETDGDKKRRGKEDNLTEKFENENRKMEKTMK
jgi:hypothetical protein